MTMPAERSRALRFAEELMQDILNPDKYPGLPEELKRRAAGVLRHYPDKSTREDMIRRDGAVNELLPFRLLEDEDSLIS